MHIVLHGQAGSSELMGIAPAAGGGFPPGSRIRSFKAHDGSPTNAYTSDAHGFRWTGSRSTTSIWVCSTASLWGIMGIAWSTSGYRLRWVLPSCCSSADIVLCSLVHLVEPALLLPRWMQVVVWDGHTGRRYTFPCNQWIGRATGLEISVPCKSDDENVQLAPAVQNAEDREKYQVDLEDV